MKLSFFVFVVLIALPVCADIPSPIPLHRIGFEVLVYVAGAAALGGGFAWRMKKKLDEADCWKTDDEISYREKEDAMRRIDENLSSVQKVYDKAYEADSSKWIESYKKRNLFGSDYPSYIVNRWRSDAWRELQQELLIEVLAQDSTLLERFRGIPIEWLCDRLAKPMPDDFAVGGRTGDPFLEIRNKYERRRKIIRALIQALVLLAVGIGEYFLWRYPLFRMLLCGNLTCVILSVGGLSLSFCFSEFDVCFTRLTGKNNAQLSDHELKRKVWRQFAVSKLTWGIVVFLALIAVCAKADIDRWHWIAVAFLWVKILVANLLWVMSGIVVSILFVRVREFGVKFVKRRHSRQEHAEEGAEQMAQPDTSTGRSDHSEGTVPFVCDDTHKRMPIVVGEHGGIVFGRSRRSDVRLDGQDVSGRHAEIVREGDLILAVCLSHQGMFVNDKAVETSGRRQLREGDCMRIGKKTEVCVVRLPKDGDDVMVVKVTDSHGTREEEIRLPMTAEGATRKDFGGEDSGRGCEEDAQHSLGVTRSASSEELSVRMADLCEERKPVIYFYPEKETTCNAKVITDGALTCTYPAHVAEGWRDFVAAPDGTLTFPDGRKFYCLYWEGTTLTRWDFSKGYCVRGSETSEFLADILAKMGLSFREVNEFVIYWLPRMQDNPYNVIAFQNEIYTQSAKLEIEPQPDSILRVFMAWRASDCPVDIPAPEIKSFERKGFTVVEWGGTEVGK